MVVHQLGLTNVSRPTEYLKITPLLKGMVGCIHHCAPTVRRVLNSADSAVERKVVHHQPDAVIGQVYHRMSLEISLLNRPQYPSSQNSGLENASALLENSKTAVTVSSVKIDLPKRTQNH